MPTSDRAYEVRKTRESLAATLIALEKSPMSKFMLDVSINYAYMHFGAPELSASVLEDRGLIELRTRCIGKRMLWPDSGHMEYIQRLSDVEHYVDTYFITESGKAELRQLLRSIKDRELVSSMAKELSQVVKEEGISELRMRFDAQVNTYMLDYTLKVLAALEMYEQLTFTRLIVMDATGLRKLFLDKRDPWTYYTRLGQLEKLIEYGIVDFVDSQYYVLLRPARPYSEMERTKEDDQEHLSETEFSIDSADGLFKLSDSGKALLERIENGSFDANAKQLLTNIKNRMLRRTTSSLFGEDLE